MTARELSEWEAYERAFGPIDGAWRDEAIADLNDNLFRLLYYFSQANFTDPKKGKVRGPVEPRERRFHRPRDVYKPDEAK